MTIQNPQTKKNSKIPKIISGIVAAIFIAFVGYRILSPLWFWIVWETLAGALVAIGCFGEWYLFGSPAKTGEEDCHRRKELQFIFVVAIGVTMEFLALAHVIPATIQLDKDIARVNSVAMVASNDATHASERAAGIEQSNLVLRTELIKLEEQNKPRTISLEQSARFAKLTEKITKKISIKIYFSTRGDDTESFSAQFIEMLRNAGFTLAKESDELGKRGDVSVGFAKTIGHGNDKTPWVYFLVNNVNNPVLSANLVFSMNADGSRQPVITSDSEQEIFVGIMNCLEQIQIPSAFVKNFENKPQREFKIYIPPKNF